MKEFLATILVLGFIYQVYGVCPAGWQETPSGTKCLRVISQKATVVESAQNCVAFGGSLASIQTPEEDAFVVNNILPNVNDWLLFGGKRDKTTGKWFWKDGSPWKYSNFSPNEATTNINHDTTFYYSHSIHQNQAHYGKWLMSNSAANAATSYISLCELKVTKTYQNTNQTQLSCGCTPFVVSVINLPNVNKVYES